MDAIAEELGDLPLALHLAGSYLSTYRAEVSLDGYLAELCTPAVLRHASLLGAGLGDSPSPTHHLQGVAQTFALCLGRLDRDRKVDRVAIALLAGMACMAPGEPVPRDLLAKTLEDVEPLQRADGIRRLAAVGLIEEGETWLRLHRLLVHFVRQEALDPDARLRVARAMIGCGDAADKGHLTVPELAGMIPHLADVAGAGREGTGDERLVAELCTATGQALQHTGDLRAARPWYERALAIRERVLGSDHPNTADSLNNLALLLRHQSELGAARPLYERALAIREQVLGSDHPDTADSLNDLAGLLRAQGEFAAAKPLLERATEIRERVLGSDHPDVATSLNNMAGILRDLGELAAARPLLERALDIRERVLGPDHSHTALTLNNLGALLRELGELAASRPLLERALDIRMRVLGPNHPGTAFSLNNLGALLRDMGDLTVAKPLLERALAAREQMLGHDHPDTATSLNSLAGLLQELGELAAARALLERAFAIRERVLGPDHPDTVSTRRALAELMAEGDGSATVG